MGLAKRTVNKSGSVKAKGTLDFMAPELVDPLGDPKTVDPYLADMWSFGETIFRMLTNQKTFENSRSLYRYLEGRLEYPRSTLSQVQASEDSMNFTQSLMKPESKERITASQAVEHKWVKSGFKGPPSTSPAELSHLPGGPLPDPLHPHNPSHETTLPSGTWGTTDPTEGTSSVASQPDSDEVRYIVHGRGTSTEDVLQQNKLKIQDQASLLPKSPDKKRSTIAVVVSADIRHWSRGMSEVS